MFSIYTTNLLVTLIVLVILSWAIYLPMRGGQLFNGPIYCAAISGYFAAYVTKVLGWPIPVGFTIGILLSGLLTFGLSFILASLNLFQMAVVTIALVFISQTVFRNLEFMGGDIGMSDIPTIDNILLICFITILILMVIMNRLEKSRWGRAMEAVEVDRDVAAAAGVDVIKMSIVLQTISGTMGGLAGVIFTFNIGTVHPAIFGFGQLLFCFTIIFVGGRWTPWGSLIFAPFLWLFPEFFPPEIAELRNIALGIIVMIFLLTRPNGIITKRVVFNVEETLRWMICLGLGSKKGGDIHQSDRSF